MTTVYILLTLCAVVLLAWVVGQRDWLAELEEPDPWPERRQDVYWAEIRASAQSWACIDLQHGTQHRNPHAPGTREHSEWAIAYCAAQEARRASTPRTQPTDQPEPHA